MTLQQSLTQIIRQAGELKLPYLLVGGHAMILYGVTRFTRDFDLLVPETHAEPWAQFLSRSFCYRLFHSSHAFLQFDGSSPNFPPVDIMLVDTSTWVKLTARAETRPLSSEITAQLPHPTHLIAMKLAALSSPYRRQDNVDWSDIINLIHEQKLSFEEPEFRSIVLRYGGEEILQKLKKALS